MSAAALPSEIFMMVIDQVYLADTKQEEEDQQQETDRQHRLNVGLLAKARLKKHLMPLNRTLAACALVCRSWLQRSRFLQFGSERGSEGIRLDLYNQPQALPELVTLLQSPLCTISPYIWKITLASLSYGSRSDLMQLAALSNFTYIALGDVGDIQRKDIPPFLACFEQIRSLDLFRFTLASFEDLRDIVCSCPRLHYLHLWDIQAEERRITDPPPRGPPPIILQPPGSLRVLVLSMQCAFGNELCDWLAASTPPVLLEKVELEAQFLMDSPASGRLLKRLGAGLRDLAINTSFIDIYEDGEVDRLNDTVDLGHNTGLCKLALYGVTAEGSDKIVPAVLDQVRACNMEEIRIELSRLDRVDARTIRWQEIDAILDRPNFAQLGGLYITISSTNEELAQDWFNDTFPRSLSKGIAHLLEPAC